MRMPFFRRARQWYLLTALLALTGAAGARECTESIPDLFERASPAVVMISGQAINPFRLRDRVGRALGSGFIIDEKGLVLTNSHVVYGLQSLSVKLDDGTVVVARLIGADPIFDVALIQLPKPERGKFPTAKLGDSDKARPGEEIIAIGNPLGLDQTVTRGIISGINRILPDTPLSLTEPLIQIDAAINPGNSGGPLLNRCGEVIGINTSIVPEAQNIGFAVPINLVKSLLPALMKDGRVIRPWVGFHGQVIGADVRRILKLPLVDGLLVEVVEPGSPAEKAGVRGGSLEFSIGGDSLLLGGDVIVTVNGTPATDPDKFATLMRGLKVGDKLKLKLYRDEKYLELDYVLPERPLLPGDLPPSHSYLPGGSTAQP